MARPTTDPPDLEHAALRREALVRLAEEQAALRRLATLVARGASPAESFKAVISEIGRLLPVDAATLGRYESDGAFVTPIAYWSPANDDRVPIGARYPIEPDSLSELVLERRGPARVDDFAEAPGDLGEVARAAGWRSAVGTPVIVEGRTWGLVGVASTSERTLPDDTEARLAAFAELLATAIANAQSRADLTRLADEQAALRRVATLVARESSPEEVFGIVAEEVAQLMGGGGAIGMLRFESDGTASLVAQSATPWEPMPLGARFTLEGENVLAPVLETGATVRFDDYGDATGTVSTAARTLGIRSSVAAPIVVEGRIWGAMVAASREPDGLPEDTGSWLEEFTELVATAIANAQALTDVRRLADEQAALRRVATLVAQERPAAEVFAAVAEEVGRLLGIEDTRIVRYEPDQTLTVVASWGKLSGKLPVGLRMPVAGENVSTLVFRTGRAARKDYNLDEVSGPIGDRLRSLGVRSAVGTPIVVEGRLWGAMLAVSTSESLLPMEAEPRIEAFTELVVTAISNIEARSELAASRGRLVVASDEERRRVVRDLHDGAQQRLVHTVVTLELARQGLESGEQSAPELVAEALEQAKRANDELRELAHGILPAVLTRGGLRSGVEALASRTPVPVEIEVSVGRLPVAVEATAYFVVAEALTNVAKHSRATRASVTARVEDDALRVSVQDDGIGGAHRDGSGLVGLGDRLGALDGRLRVQSPSGGGTLVAAEIPLAAGPTPAR